MAARIPHKYGGFQTSAPLRPPTNFDDSSYVNEFTEMPGYASLPSIPDDAQDVLDFYERVRPRDKLTTATEAHKIAIKYCFINQGDGHASKQIIDNLSSFARNLVGYFERAVADGNVPLPIGGDRELATLQIVANAADRELALALEPVQQQDRRVVLEHLRAHYGAETFMRLIEKKMRDL